jgi:hypothetical protein
MATGGFSSTVQMGASRAAAGQQSQAIDAQYYNITDIQSWPIAGLLVLLDGAGQPVRAELHLYDDLASHVQEAAVRQARMILQERYVGSASVPLRILETQQMREALDVRLATPSERPVPRTPRSWTPVALAAGGILAVALLVWGVVAWAGSGSSQTSSVGEDQSVESAEQAAVEEAAIVEGDVAAAEPAEVSGVVGTDAGVALDETLPTSRNARPDLGIGMRIAIIPGLQLALRSEPGAEAGTVVGSMSDGEQATIIGGPRLTRGESDTIVWWLVQLADGTQAWAAANTSQQTLLVPAP